MVRIAVVSEMEAGVGVGMAMKVGADGRRDGAGNGDAVEMGHLAGGG